MSAIDKLKNGSGVISFDTTVPGTAERTIKAGENMAIDMVSGSEEKVSVQSSEPEVNLGNLRKGKHQMVLPKEKQQPPVGSGRAVASIMEIGTPTPTDESIHESPEKDMLNLEDPNSIFSTYVKQKEEEAREWVAEKEEEKRVLEEEKANGVDAEDDAEIGVVSDEEESEEGVIVTGNDELDQRMVGSYNMANVMNEDISALVEDAVEEETDEVVAEDEFVDEFEDDEDEYLAKEDSEDTVAADQPKVPVTADMDVDVDVVSGNSIMDEVVEEDEDEIAAENSDNEDVLKHLQKMATEKLKPVSKELDISSFTVLKKPVSNVTAFKESSARVAKWILPTQDSIVLMKEFSGAELEKLREYSENARSTDALNRRFNMIYSHIMSPKPASFETWLKTTPFDDVDSYFFAIYIASFKGANYLPADCPNPACKETFLSDNIDIMNMVEFEDDATKKRFVELYQSEATPAGKGIYCTEIVPLSDKVAISFRQPSIYNIFEVASMDDKTRSDYSSIIDYIPYIDTIYSIDMANKSLVPIGYKMFPDNNQRTIRSKIQKFNSILATLTIDEFAVIKAYVKAIAEKDSGIYYTYPAIECPKCHNTTEKQRTTAEELVFTRYQLGALVSTSLN